MTQDTPRGSGMTGGSHEGRHGDPEAAYYQAIEEFFVSRRGDPLFLSNADWHLIRKWRSAGIPLRVVFRGIADALDSHAHSWSRTRKVGSLAYCAAEVEAARERWQRALAFEAEEGGRSRELLGGLADALEGGRGLGPAASALTRELARSLREKGDADADLKSLEKWLRGREAELLAVLEREMGRQAVARIGAAVDADLLPYRDRMPAQVIAQIRRESIFRRVLEVHSLPRLSLFHLF